MTQGRARPEQPDAKEREHACRYNGASGEVKEIHWARWRRRWAPKGHSPAQIDNRSNFRAAVIVHFATVSIKVPPVESERKAGLCRVAGVARVLASRSAQHLPLTRQAWSATLDP